MIVNFETNPDKKTCSMVVDNLLTFFEIPYIPEKCVDHRGLYLYYFMKKKGINSNINDVEFSKSTHNPNEIVRGFKYMSNPIFVKKAIQSFKNRE